MGGGTATGGSAFLLVSKNEEDRPPSELKVLVRSPRSNDPIPPTAEGPVDEPVRGVSVTGGDVTLKGEDFVGDVTRGGDMTLIGAVDEAEAGGFCWVEW